MKNNALAALAGFLLAVCASLLAGQASENSPGIVRASGFVLCDEKGVARGQLGFDPSSGSPSLVLFSGDGTERLTLGIDGPFSEVTKGISLLRMVSANGATVVNVGAYDEGATIQLTFDDSREVNLQASEGLSVVRLFSYKDGNSLMEEDQRNSIELRSSNDEVGAFINVYGPLPASEARLAPARR